MALQKRATPQSKITETGNGWRLEIPAGDRPVYRLAQLDDYAALPRKNLPWNPPTTLKLRCRVSEQNLPGTWGFGFWNDPFAVSFGLQGMARRLPTLPNCLWFFHASPENYLSFASETNNKDSREMGIGRDKVTPNTHFADNLTTRRLPYYGNGFLAQVFSAPRIPSLLLAPAGMALPLLLWKTASAALRRAAGKIIREDSQLVDVDPTEWHEYQLQWGKESAAFRVDGNLVFETSLLPRGPLGLVIWIDNQYAAWRPDGALAMGSLPNPAAWMDVQIIGLVKE